MTKLLVANWKMNQNVKEIKEFLAVFNEKYAKINLLQLRYF